MPSQFIHKTFQHTSYQARERAQFDKCHVRPPSEIRTFFCDGGQIVVTSISTSVYLNKRARVSQETFRGVSRLGSLTIGSESAEPTSYHPTPRVSTPGVGHFYAPFNDFSHPSAAHLGLCIAPERAAKNGSKSLCFPNAVPTFEPKLSATRPRWGEDEFTTRLPRGHPLSTTKPDTVAQVLHNLHRPRAAKPLRPMADRGRKKRSVT